MKPLTQGLAHIRDSVNVTPIHSRCCPALNCHFLLLKIYMVPPPYLFPGRVLSRCELGCLKKELILIAYKIINDKLGSEETVTKLCDLYS